MVPFMRWVCPSQEMVLDKVEGVMRPRYLIYDVMQFEVGGYHGNKEGWHSLGVLRPIQVLQHGTIRRGFNVLSMS